MIDDVEYSCSLVIRCCNEEQHIGRLLAGIMEQTVKDVEIILVDSGSTDATLSIASRYPARIISIQPEDFSFGRSLNIGCRAASGEFIIMASAHVYPVYKDWLRKILEPFRDSDVAVVYGRQKGDRNTQYSEHQIYRKWYPDNSNDQQRHPFCNNANAAIRRSVWLKLPYNEDLTGLEDIDWAKRILAGGKKIVYSAEAEIIHVHNEAPRNIYNRYRREAIAFKHIYPQERFQFRDFIKLFSANVISDYYHALLDGMLLKNIFSIPAFRFLQFKGTYRGYQQHRCITQELRNQFYYPNRLFGKKAVNSIRDTKRKIDYEHY